MPKINISVAPLLNAKELKNFLSKINKIHRGYVDENGIASRCWEWDGTRYPSGYGQIRIRRLSHSPIGTHRISLAHFKDFDLDSGLCSCHKCDNPPCCNPDHLFEGTQRDNWLDMRAKNRWVATNQKGEHNGNSTLSSDDVLMVVTLLPKYNNKQISEMLNGKITHSMVSNIRRGKSWGHISGISQNTYKKYSSLKALVSK